MAYDITDMKTVQNLTAQINISQNIDRKEDIADGHRIMRGDLDHYVEQRLAQLWTKTHKYFRRSNASITKKIIDTKSTAYQESPMRVLDTEEETTAYKELTSKFKLDKSMELFDKTNNLDHYAALWVNRVMEEGDEEPTYTFRALNQSQFDRIINKQTMETEVVIVSMPESLVLEQIHGDNTLTDIQDESEDADKMVFYAMWTKENHIMIAFNKKNHKMKMLPIEGNENMINPLGMLPFVFLQEGDILSVPVRPSLPYKDIELNSCRSVLLTGCDVQALGKLIIKHPANQKVPKTVFDSPFTNTTLPQSTDEGSPETTAEYITPNTNVAEFKEVLDAYEKAIIEEEGITVQQTGDSSFSSGFERNLAMQSVRTIVEMNQRDYAQVENDIYLIVKRFHEAENSNIFRSERLKVLFPKPRPIQSRSEILDEIEKEIALGTIESWEKHIRLNPNLTEEEAREKDEAIQNQRANNALNLALSFDNREE